MHLQKMSRPGASRRGRHAGHTVRHGCGSSATIGKARCPYEMLVGSPSLPGLRRKILSSSPPCRAAIDWMVGVDYHGRKLPQPSLKETKNRRVRLMRLLVQCPHCKRQYNAGRRSVGSRFRCPCGRLWNKNVIIQAPCQQVPNRQTEELRCKNG